jgi:hypothetical protein
MLQIRHTGKMPRIANQHTDVELPRQLWSAWKERGHERTVVRALNEGERFDLQDRRNELEPWVVGFHDNERDDVIIALGKMFNAFPSMMGKSDIAVVSKTDQTARSLAPYPAWAIVKVCDRIKMQGYVRTEGERYVTERHWPPSDPEIVELVRLETKLYRDSYDSADALLNAKTEK